MQSGKGYLKIFKGCSKPLAQPFMYRHPAQPLIEIPFLIKHCFLHKFLKAVGHQLRLHFAVYQPNAVVFWMEKQRANITVTERKCCAQHLELLQFIHARPILPTKQHL